MTLGVEAIVVQLCTRAGVMWGALPVERTWTLPPPQRTWCYPFLLTHNSLRSMRSICHAVLCIAAFLGSSRATTVISNNGVHGDGDGRITFTTEGDVTVTVRAWCPPADAWLVGNRTSSPPGARLSGREMDSIPPWRLGSY